MAAPLCTGTGIVFRGRGAIAAAVLMCLLAPQLGSARHGRDQPHGDAQSAAGTITKDQAIAAAERRHKARVVRAETQESDGRRVYVLRMLSDEGRVWTVKVDAATGAEK